MEKGNRKLNWRQACDVIGCSRNRFYNLVRNGFLPAYRLRGVKKGLWVYEKDCIALVEKIAKSVPQS